MIEAPHREVPLAQGAWRPEVHAALCDLIARYGIESPDYDAERPPLVTIDCDNTLIHNDIGEAMMRYIITRRRLNTDRGFWQSLVPDRLGRDALNAAYKAVAGRSDPEVRDTAAFRRYRAGMLGVYETLRETEGRESAYLFACRLMRGMHERTVIDLVDEVLDYELDRPLSHEDIPSGPPFGGLVVPTGVRVYHEMVDLIGALETHGFSTWIITSSNAYVVRGLARRIGFPEERVLGIELQLQGGRYTDRIVDPAPIGEGKRELFLDTVGRSPILAMGDSMNDFELLENCEGLSIVIDHGDEEMIEKAEEFGWLIQSPLSV
ncbi:MAG: haloacid dehalogenase-like hydrolase [Myxococcales bacterium]|nr:haloacid dehalogenase-like hydrolase [Myxococcales bacterium]